MPSCATCKAIDPFNAASKIAHVQGLDRWHRLPGRSPTGTVPAFLAHRSPAGAGEIAVRVAAGTIWPSVGIAQMFTHDRKAVCWAVPSRRSVQWNPASHLCVAAHVRCVEPRGTLMLSRRHPRRRAATCSPAPGAGHGLKHGCMPAIRWRLRAAVMATR